MFSAETPGSASQCVSADSGQGRSRQCCGMELWVGISEDFVTALLDPSFLARSTWSCLLHFFFAAAEVLYSTVVTVPRMKTSHPHLTAANGSAGR